VAIALRAYTTAVANGNVTCNVPSGVSNGDFLVAQIAKFGSSTTNENLVPDGWTEFYRGNNGSTSANMICYRWANNEPASYVFTSELSTAARVAIMSAWTGVNATNPIHASNSSTTIGLTPSLDTTVANCLVLSMCGGGQRRVVYTAPGGVTGVVSIESNTGTYASVAAALGYFLQATAGSTGNKTWSASITADYSGINWQIALAPTAAGGAAVKQMHYARLRQL
jgi:hypothetical protein